MPNEKPFNTPASTAPSRDNAEPLDVQRGTVTVYGNWGKFTCDALNGMVLSYDRSDSDSVSFTDGYADIVRVDLDSYRKLCDPNAYVSVIDIILIGYWTADGKYEPPAESHFECSRQHALR